MTLSRALSSAQSGLSATALRADITAGNVANATSPGYVRREVVTSENIIGGRGNGVRIAGISRAQDFALTRIRREADASLGRSTLITQTYVQINQELGSPGDGFGLFSSYENFESSLRDLAVTPESAALQNSTYAAANTLVSQFNDLSAISQNLRQNADASIARDVNTVNSALIDLQKINQSISGVGGGNGAIDISALEDERQRLLDTIGQIIPIRDIPRAGGQIDVITDTGVFLLTNDVHEISFTPSNAILPGSSFAAGTGGLSGLTVGGQDITPGAGGSFSINSGSIAGYFKIRDEIVPEFNTQIDTLAADLIERFSDDAIDPTKTPGAAGLFTDAGGTLDVTNIPGLAGRLRLNAAVDPAQGGELYRLRDGLGAAAPGASGNADILNNLLQAFTTTLDAPAGTGLSGLHSSTELVAGITSVIGESVVRHEAITASVNARAEILSDAELETSAVDTDQELQKLLIVERAYAANARVIQTVSELLDQLLRL